METQTLHRTYEGEPGSKTHVYYVASEGECKRLSETKGAKWVNSLKEGQTLRVTQAHSTDALLLEIAQRGVLIQYAHWHSTGIATGLPPEEISLAFAGLPQDKFKNFKPRPELADLRHMVDARAAIMEHRKADLLRLSALKRTFGGTDDDELPPQLQAVFDEINTDKRRFETPVDKKIAELASVIPECVTFNLAAGIGDSWGTAATIVALLGDISRFPTLSSMRHYSGMHVCDGVAPKREKGKPQDWNPRVRTALYLLGTSIIKNRNNRWRPVYEQFIDAELAVHDTKHPDCPAKQGHCGARARRKVVKEILKEFYVQVSNDSGSHATCENQGRSAETVTV